MVAIGSNAATSVWVSNELGAGHPRTAKFSVVVVMITSFFIVVFLSMILIIMRDQYPLLFTNSEEVKKLEIKLTPLLVTLIIVNNVQPVLSENKLGFAIGAGWQAAVAYVNVGCYYIFGIPLGLTLGYKLNLGMKCIWYGMLSCTVVQTLILFLMTYRTDWNKEASIAGDRIRTWGGEGNVRDNELVK